ncbi:hypothetical protein BRADI_2g08853v3, partial [Brachypodium distachyon]
ADLWGACRRRCFCVTCLHAFCPHCCDAHHSPRQLHLVIRVDVVNSHAGGRRLVFATHYSDGEPIYPSHVQDTIASEDYATWLPRDAFCLLCHAAFSAAACRDHHGRHHGPRVPEAVLRIEERGVRHCVRCTGSEWWFPYVEMILDDPVHEDGEDQLLPVLTAKPGTCMQCGYRPFEPLGRNDAFLCSTGCSQRHQSQLAGRRQRRNAWRAARGLPRHATFDHLQI